MKTHLLIISLLFLTISSCKKQEGEGGNSSIEGQVFRIDYADEYSFKLDTFPAMDEDVYIVYGGGTFSDDDLKTNYEGRFQFKYLRPGDYDIFVYSSEPEKSELKVPIAVSVTLGKKDNKTLAPIYIYTSNEGHSSVFGKVLLSEYTGDGLFVEEYYAGDVDVFICREGELMYFDKVKTHFDGTYLFPHLRIGNYYVYAYSKDIEHSKTTDKSLVVTKAFSIDSFGQQVFLEDINIKH